MIKVLAVIFLFGAVTAQSGGDDHGHHKVVDYFAPAHYKFEYSVHDPHTHDIKKQAEERKDDDVKGYYSLHEPDGTVREVHYTSDKHNGFNAVVHRSGHAQHPQKYGSSDERYYHGHGGLGGGIGGGVGGGESGGHGGGASSSYSFDGHY